MKSSAVIWEGASRIDGAPIVVIATGMDARSANPKTGAMVQTYIIRADVAPVDAIRTGQDASICGDCVHRGEGFSDRTCYVNVGQGPRSVYAAYKRGSYWRMRPIDAGAGRMVRLGTYGDPAAVPAVVWRALLRRCIGHTGYTHQWRRAPDLRRLVMASVDSPEEAREAHAMGWRTFRVTRTSTEAPVGREIVCPASEEAGKKLTCSQCGACDGASGRRGSIRIKAHGSLASDARLEAMNARLIARLIDTDARVAA